MSPTARRIILAAIFIVAALVFTAGIDWGLPQRRLADRFLLGADHHGMRLEGLTARVPEVDASHGADVTTAIGPADQLLPENDTDAKRAQILCRYRLYSFQPDEMITFRSLSQMKPRQGDLDPRLYQYGGLWIYGVGAIIEIGGHLGFLDVTDRSTYIGNPELFAKFYIAARAYSALFGLIAVWAVFAIVHRWTRGSTFHAALAALTFIFLPVVVVMSHEAKPHLGGAALILLAVLGADSFVQSKKMQWACGAGALCGAAAGMVLWAAAGWIILPMMGLLARGPRAAIYGLLVASAVYSVTNPYVIYHLVFDPGALWSNLGNTSAMYNLGRPDLAVINAIQLAIAGAGPLAFAAGLVGAACWVRKWPSPLCILLGAPALLIAIPFIVMAAGKPGEYGRFALLPDVGLAIVAVIAISRAIRAPVRFLLAATLLIGTIAFGVANLRTFLADSQTNLPTSRQIASRRFCAT
jgi:hypothetical protein